MNQIGFKGYAQSLGFDPVKAPDESKKILESGQQEINNLERTANWESKQRNEYLGALVRKNQVERENRVTNFELERDWKKGYQEAILKNNQTVNQNNQNQVQNVIDNYAALSVFSKTAGELVTGFKKQWDEGQEEAGQQFVLENGVSREMYLKIKAGEDLIDQGDTAIQGAANNAPSAEIRARILKLSGRQLLGASKQWLIQGAQEYAGWMAENSKRPIEVLGKEMTLDQARMSSPETYAAAYSTLRREYMKKYQGIAFGLQDKYLMEGIRRADAADQSSYRTTRDKALQVEEDSNNTRTLIKESQAGRDPQVIVDWYMRRAGGDRTMVAATRTEAIGLLTQSARAGQFGTEGLQALRDLPISLGGATPKPFGELYGTELLPLETAVRDRNNIVRGEQEQAQSDSQKDFKERYFAAKNQKGSPFSKAELRAFADHWEHTMHSDVPGWLKDEQSEEQLSSELADEVLLHLDNQGLLDMSVLTSGKYNDITIKKWRPSAEKNALITGASKASVDSANKRIDAALKESLQTIGKGYNQNESYFNAQGKAQRDLSARVRALVAGGISAETAYDQATKDLVLEIKEGAQGKGLYALKGTYVNGKFQPLRDDMAAFAMSSSSGTVAAQQKRTTKIISDIKKNPNSLGVVTYLNQSEIDQIVAFGQRGTGSLPPLLGVIASNLGRNSSILDVANAQLKAYHRPPIGTPPTAALYDQISPEARSLLTWRPSRARTLQALERSGQPYAPLLDLIASEESLTTDRQNKGYDAFNYKTPGGSYRRSNSLNGTKISQLTVGEIMAEQNADRLYAVGRYQYIPTTLASRVRNGIVQTTDIFNAQTQDKLAISSIKNKAGRFYSGVETAEQVIPGLGNEWLGLRLVDRKRLAQALQQSKVNLQNFNVDSSDWKPGVVYRVSGIGPKGKTHYGPHIDAKLSDNSYFDRNYLDKYVEVSVSGKRVPISAGGRASGGGGDFGAPRDYGSHTGWDYAFPEGTPVHLKNGARVVRKQPTNYGTKLTIALPDGRTVNFLHGNG